MIGCVAALFLAYGATGPLQDFSEYWTSAHEFVGGRDPYSLTRIMQLERAMGWTRPVPLMNLNPPWSLPIIAPLGLLQSYRLAWIGGTLLLALVAWWATKLLCEIYSPGRPIFASTSDQGILVFTFFPAVMCLKFSQTSALCLLGVATFLWFERQNRDVLAGACLSMAAIKPQLLYLVWIALGVECWRRRRWRLLGSFAAALAALIAVACLVRPHLLADYWNLSRSDYVKVWPSALGATLRLPFGYSKSNFLLQFVAPVVGFVWFASDRMQAKRRGWLEELPALVTVSVFTSVYAWYFDQILLLVPIVAIAAGLSASGHLPRWAAIVYTAINVLSFALLFVPKCGINLAFLVAPPAVIVALARLKIGLSTPVCVPDA
jgi:hypothetical protein